MAACMGGCMGWRDHRLGRQAEAVPPPAHLALFLCRCGHMHSQIHVFGRPRPGGLAAVDVWWRKAVSEYYD